MNKLLRRGLAVTGAGVGLSLAIVAGFTEPTPPEPVAGQKAIGHWEGYPFIPGDIGDAVNSRLPADYQKNGRMFINLYHDSETGDNYGKVTYNLTREFNTETTIMCTPNDELDFGFRLSQAEYFGRAVVEHAVVEHDRKGDLAERTCHGGELTASSIQAFAQPNATS